MRESRAVLGSPTGFSFSAITAGTSVVFMLSSMDDVMKLMVVISVMLLVRFDDASRRGAVVGLWLCSGCCWNTCETKYKYLEERKCCSYF